MITPPKIGELTYDALALAGQLLFPVVLALLLLLQLVLLVVLNLMLNAFLVYKLFTISQLSSRTIAPQVSQDNKVSHHTPFPREVSRRDSI
jgi:hypothetical protein